MNAIMLLPASRIETLGERIRRLREKRGWTQEDLAERVFYSKMQVCLWENNRRKVSPNALQLLATAFRCQVEELLSGCIPYNPPRRPVSQATRFARSQANIQVRQQKYWVSRKKVAND